MQIATWNVNSLRMRQGLVLDWLRANPVDVLALQETKVEDEKFPRLEFEALGYRAAINGQKTYNGVALLARHELADVAHGIAGFEDEQRRVIAATVLGVRVCSVYVPNGQSVGSDKYEYKLRWLRSFAAHLGRELAAHPQLAVMGDYNVAPADEDVHDPAAWKDRILCSDPERAAFRELLAAGFADSFRLFAQPPGCYSWWDYRMGAFRRNFGLRIDHILLSADLAARCRAVAIDTVPRRRPQPSDHTPVVATLD